MANVDKLNRTRNDIIRMEQHIQDSQKRFKELKQRLLKLEEQDFIRTVREAGLSPEELREMIRIFNQKRLLDHMDVPESDSTENEFREEEKEFEEEQESEEESDNNYFRARSWRNR